MADHRDEQQANGVLPSIIPTGGWGYEWGNGPDWTSTIAIIPWNIYLFYGDTSLLSQCYENIKRYVDHITDISAVRLTTWGLGDWVPVRPSHRLNLLRAVLLCRCQHTFKYSKTIGEEAEITKSMPLLPHRSKMRSMQNTWT